MNFRCILWLAALGTALGNLGCQTTRAARIQEKAALYATLNRDTQRLITQGLFDHGFTPDLLYMSLGKPNRVTATDDARGRVEVWLYRNFLYGNEEAVKIGIATPGMKPGGTVLSSSAPGGPSLMSTKASPSQPTVTDVNDVALGTLLIELVEGRVVAARVLK